MLVLGLDLSLTSTGGACGKCGPFLVSSKRSGPARLEDLWQGIRTHVDHNDCCVLENYGYMSLKGIVQGELGGVVRWMLWRCGMPVVVIPPAKLKKYATTSGDAKKERVLLAAVRKLGYEGESNDEADALWLQHMGLGAAGEVEVTNAQRAILDGIEFPELVL